MHAPMASIDCHNLRMRQQSRVGGEFHHLRPANHIAAASEKEEWHIDLDILLWDCLACCVLHSKGMLAMVVALITIIGGLNSVPEIWAGYITVVLFVLLRPLYYFAMS
jgi:uncharacterized protein YuzB (UPF0349 family)